MIDIPTIRQLCALALAGTAYAGLLQGRVHAQDPDPAARAAATEAKMTDAERFGLLHGIMPLPIGGVPPPEGIKPTAGYVAGVPRLDVPALLETDASLGVANPRGARPGDVATAMPSGLALAATFDPGLAYQGGSLIGAEARAKGFNVLLGGGMNLTRDPRNGRNFEYLGEDPLLAGTLAGEAVRGTQSEGVISTLKHFALNAQETLRTTLDAEIDEAALRESDLLAFEIAIERGEPGAIMCAYNLVNGTYACGNDWLLNDVLKGDWGYLGWVMSDWGAVHDVGYFNAGLDQQSASQLDDEVWFDGPLKAEVAAGRVTNARLSDAVRRILRSIYAVGADRPAEGEAIDYAAHAEVARRAAAAGIVVLANDGVLPLADSERSVLVIGGHADIGVLSGGGSSQVVPVGGPAATIHIGGSGPGELFGEQLIVPSPPLAALREALPAASIEFDSGYSPEVAAARATGKDLAIVFATQWQTEGIDAGGLRLPAGQDTLIAAVAAANPNTIVVLETGNPVSMPWRGNVRAIVEAWYPGQQGGPAIADVVTGAVDPSGRLPITFPVDTAQNPRPEIPGLSEPAGARIRVRYEEGSDVGYRWFAAHDETPLFAFGHGLAYTTFEHSSLTIAPDGTSAQLRVRNTGERRGTDVPQLYLVSAAGRPLQRLAAFGKVALGPGQSETVELAIEPRILAAWEDDHWRIAAGTYRFAVGHSAADLGPTAEVELAQMRLEPATSAAQRSHK